MSVRRIVKRYIVFEGIDGSGKSTQIELLQEYLHRKTYTAIKLGEPTYGRHGKLVRQRMENGPPISVEQQERMFTLDRRQHVTQKIRPLLRFLKRNTMFMILQDRSYLSSAAFQAIGFSKDELHGLITAQKSFAPEPDIFLLLDLPVDVALARLGRSRLRMSQLETRDSLRAARRRYRILASLDKKRVRVINANGTPEQVHQRTLKTLGLSPH